MEAGHPYWSWVRRGRAPWGRSLEGGNGASGLAGRSWGVAEDPGLGPRQGAIKAAGTGQPWILLSRAETRRGRAKPVSGRGGAEGRGVRSRRRLPGSSETSPARRCEVPLTPSSGNFGAPGPRSPCPSSSASPSSWPSPPTTSAPRPGPPPSWRRCPGAERRR